MLTAIAAAIALAVAGLSLYLTIRNRNTLQALADALDVVAEDAEEETTELWVSEGDMHAPDLAAIYEATGALALCMSDGVPCAVIPGLGVVSLHKLLSGGEKTVAMRTVK